MSLTQWHGTLPRALGVLLALDMLCGIALAQMTTQMNTTPMDSAQPPDPAAWAVRRPNTAHRLPLARLIRNPDEAGSGPKYALADQSGNIQRYVEPVPGIDLEPYVGYAVKVRHDTGRTLLASQLVLPGQESESILDDGAAEQAAPTPRAESLFRGLIEAPNPMASSLSDPSWQNGAIAVRQAQ